MHMQKVTMHRLLTFLLSNHFNRPSLPLCTRISSTLSVSLYGLLSYFIDHINPVLFLSFNTFKLSSILSHL